ncbi:pYEATS domain-containing protein [Isoptericola sp. NPDC019482]|uniref:pYEATS domain-containing protein n=1 Tax=Isoptericola sp. NPDC019482 TaxID=3154688 RepID=UPI0034738277
MDRYPRPFDPTRDSVARRVAEWFAAAGVSSLLALAVALAAGGVKPVAWVLAGGVTLVGVGLIVSDERRLRRLDDRDWTTDRWNLLRENEYRQRQGVFLTHTATATTSPTDDGRKWWTVSVQLVQHGDGPLSGGTVKEVEYSFGPRFEEGRVTRQNPQDDFRYETALYGPLLVLGRVVFTNRLKRPLIVERYIDLPEQ